MNKENVKNKPFDLTTHIRDAKGSIIKSQPYRLTIINGVHEYERPPGSGYVYTGGGELIRKPSDEKIKAQQAKEFSNDQLLKQIEELQEKLRLQESLPVEVPMKEDVVSENPVLVQEVTPKFNKPSYIK